MKSLRFVNKIKPRYFSNNTPATKFNIYEFLGNKTVAEKEQQLEFGELSREEVFGADYYHYESPLYLRERFSLHLGLALIFGMGITFLYSYNKESKERIVAMRDFVDKMENQHRWAKPINQ